MTAIDTDEATRLREAIMSVARAARLHRGDHGLTLTQVTVLGYLDRSGTTTVADLAARMHVRVQSLTVSMNKLDDAELIVRRTDPDDRRRQLVELTDAGRELLLDDRAKRDEWLAEAVAHNLDETERGLIMLCVPLLERLAADRVGHLMPRVGS
ncbi:MarR family winged helix-turn-helix transcriptional regulator [Williamsia maris]|uniref:DNA-binding transcriptional regulator, MarR family n=1 Tax=Williamsia maris TaxID=72806 RepID=A0ABT1HIQ3_9NOCA|nr:MarR family transcriptional regulator [Williamsia maris]MCP2177815.1 DNA-binding transcriptional regulator, MarR family [Williamsia maris]